MIYFEYSVLAYQAKFIMKAYSIAQCNAPQIFQPKLFFYFKILNR